jgi:hypothetical protein
VQRIANRGSVDIAQMEPCIYSLFQIDADDVPSVYGEPGAVATGARQVVAQLTGEPEREMELTRYVIALMRHERNLANRATCSPRSAAHLGAAAARGDLPLLDREVLAGLAGIYQDTISKLDAAHHRARQPAVPAESGQPGPHPRPAAGRHPRGHALAPVRRHPLADPARARKMLDAARAYLRATESAYARSTKSRSWASAGSDRVT